MIVRERRAARLVITVVACLLTAVACGGSATPRPEQNHGRIVAVLPIPFRPSSAKGKADVVAVTVTQGQRFSVKVDTSDGPVYWSPSGVGPDARIVSLAGDVNIGSCPADQVGCRVPYFHTLVARGQGTTVMRWTYHNLSCLARNTASPAKPCPQLATVTFDITVR